MQLYSLIDSELRDVEKEIENLLKTRPSHTYGMLTEFIKNGGKRLRPALLLMCCKALKGDIKKAIRPAALLEMFHNFSLIHDDIADGSFFRRGKPTLHRIYGIPIALNSGDALYTLVWNTMVKLDMPKDKVITLSQRFGNAFARVAEGQGEELDWYYRKEFNITEQDYFRMIEGKTASLIGLACESGAWLADAPTETQNSLRKFGEKLGLAFQVQDDLLNISGNFDEYKKKIGEDITEGKRTLMVIHVLENATQEEKNQVIKILSSRTRNAKSISYVATLFKRYEALDYASSKAHEFINQAKPYLDVLPDNDEKRALSALMKFVVERHE